MYLLKVKNLSTHFFTRYGVVKAVDGVDLMLRRGTMLGLAGESGSGKSTLALSIMRLLPYNGRVVQGEIFIDEQNIVEMSESEIRKRIRWSMVSMIFQGALNALNPLIHVGDQIAEPSMLHEKLSKDDAIEKAKHLLEQVGVSGEKIHNYPFELSGGMKQRIMICMALICNPKIVIADEPTTALDAITSWQTLDLIKNLRRQFNLSMVLITHDLSVIAQTCDNIAIMYAGKIFEHGDVKSIFERTLHPYTEMLINSFPNIKNLNTYIKPIGGSSPDPINPPAGCRFHPRCPYAMDICRKEEPQLREVANGHFVSCHLVDGGSKIACDDRRYNC